MIQSVYDELLTEEQAEEVREAGEGEVHFATVAYTQDAVLPPLILSTDEGVSVGEVETRVVEETAFGTGDVAVAEGVDIESFKFAEEPLTEEERQQFFEANVGGESDRARIRCLVCGWSEELLPRCSSQMAGVSCDCYD